MNRLRILLLLAGSIVTWWAVAGDLGPVIPKGKGESCVADTDFMRRNHMDLLVHQRDETVLDGIRDKPFSLAECVDCHVQTADNGEHHRIDAEGQFCQSCHAYAAVKVDCFGCHAATPDAKDSTASNPVKLLTTARLGKAELIEYLAIPEHDRTAATNN